MKLLVYIPLILLGAILNAQEVNEVETNTEWTGRHCRGNVGMCNSSPKTGGNTSVNLSGNKLKFKVYRDRITIEEETTILGKDLNGKENDIYLMHEPFDLGKDLRAALGLVNETIIPVGKYPVRITNEFVEITFTIEMK